MTHTCYELLIPKETLEDKPVYLTMPIDYGILTRFDLVIPDGQMSIAKARVLYHERPLFPWNRDSYYSGDGIHIPISCFIPIMTEPYELLAEGYNLSSDYDHTIFFMFNVQRPEELGLSELDFLIQYNLKKLEGQVYAL